MIFQLLFYYFYLFFPIRLSQWTSLHSAWWLISFSPPADIPSSSSKLIRRRHHGGWVRFTPPLEIYKPCKRLSAINKSHTSTNWTTALAKPRERRRRQKGKWTRWEVRGAWIEPIDTHFIDWIWIKQVFYCLSFRYVAKTTWLVLNAPFFALRLPGTAIDPWGLDIWSNQALLHRCVGQIAPLLVGWGYYGLLHGDWKL